MGITTQCDIAIVGSGIAGAAAAHCLAAAEPGRKIVLIDRQQPLSLTTAKSGENFRACWPQQAMAELAERSIALMEAASKASNHTLGMKFSGYHFVSESPVPELFGGSITMNDVLESECVTHFRELKRRWPYLSESVRQIVCIPRAGNIDVHALGLWMLRQARACGVTLETANVTSIEPRSGGYRLGLSTRKGARCLDTVQLLLTAGPFNGHFAAQCGIHLPLQNFLQHKVVLPDPLGVVPRNMPFTIFTDPQYLNWTEEEKDLLAADPEYAWLLERFPGGLHIKPEPGGRIKLGWAYNRQPVQPVWEPVGDEQFPDIVIRGAGRFVPGLLAYVNDMPTPVVTYSGYYTRTPENWPLIGPLGPPGLFTVAGLSGFGTMVACAVGELVAAWMTGGSLPPYAPYFHPDRYNNPEIVTEMAAAASDGQL